MTVTVSARLYAIIIIVIIVKSRINGVLISVKISVQVR